MDDTDLRVGQLKLSIHHTKRKKCNAAVQEQELVELLANFKSSGVTAALLQERARLYKLAVTHFPELLPHTHAHAHVQSVWSADEAVNTACSTWASDIGISSDCVTSEAAQRGL